MVHNDTHARPSSRRRRRLRSPRPVGQSVPRWQWCLSVSSVAAFPSRFRERNTFVLPPSPPAEETGGLPALFFPRTEMSPKLLFALLSLSVAGTAAAPAAGPNDACALQKNTDAERFQLSLLTPLFGRSWVPARRVVLLPSWPIT